MQSKSSLLQIFIVIIALFLPSNINLSATKTYKNPVLAINFPDPTVFYDQQDKCFYAWCTFDAKYLYWQRSTDLVHWETSNVLPFPHSVFASLKQFGKHFWAPQITKIGNQYLLYFTIRSSGDDSRIVVFSTPDLHRYFRFEGVLTDGLRTNIRDTIDPYVFQDNEGHVWMSFGSVGKVHLIELTADGLHVKRGAAYKHIAGRTMVEDPSRKTVFEGTYMHYHDGWWYLFASSGHWNDHTYTLVVGRSRSPEGPFVSKEGRLMTDGAATVLLSSEKNDRFFGPGHNGEIITDAKGQDYMFYHCHVAGMSKNPSDFRVLCMQPLYWGKDGWPYFKENKPQEVCKSPRLN